MPIRVWGFQSMEEKMVQLKTGEGRSVSSPLSFPRRIQVAFQPTWK